MKYYLSKLLRIPFISFVLMLEIFKSFKSKLTFFLLKFRREKILLLGKQGEIRKGEKILVLITHIANLNEVANPFVEGKQKLGKLANTIDGLLLSLAAYELKIVINTVRGQNLVDVLAQYQKDIVTISDDYEGDPFLLGFAAQEIFVANKNKFDFFMFLEDDIVIYDQCLIQKIKDFNFECGSQKKILLPNRYEMHEGKKFYIDMVPVADPVVHNRLSEFCNKDEIKFAEPINPHSGFYCLSREQLDLWIASNRHWFNKTSFVGPLESAATGCLMECFDIYRPTADNIDFFEVRHWDTKYSKIFAKWRD
jgi:hypothetical protein